jgi:hypothetical protein
VSPSEISLPCHPLLPCLLILSLVLIPLVIFLLLLFPWLAASYGVEKKGDKIKQKKVNS